jgi:hypothetical protein
MQLSQVDVIGDGSISTDHSFSMLDPNVKDARVIVLDLHDGHEVPENVDAVIADKTSLCEYITVERDTGMSLMRTLLLKVIPGSIGIHVRAPRGIVDANRHPEYALPLNFSQEVSAAMMQTHANTQTAIRELLKHCSTKVVVLDLHSMSPKSPDGEAPQTTMDTLHEHALYWERSLKTGTPRDIDIIDSDESGIIGNRALSQRIGDSLGRGIPLGLQQTVREIKEASPDRLHQGSRRFRGLHEGSRHGKYRGGVQPSPQSSIAE